MRLPGDSSPFSGSLEATSGSQVELECAVTGGNPPPGLQWYLGGQRWEEGDRVIENVDQVTGITVSTVRLPVSRLDNDKEIRCEVIHEALTTILEVSTKLDIQCKYYHDLIEGEPTPTTPSMIHTTNISCLPP